MSATGTGTPSGSARPTGNPFRDAAATIDALRALPQDVAKKRVPLIVALVIVGLIGAFLVMMQLSENYGRDSATSDRESQAQAP
jgi:hypothetical protein